MNYVTEDLIGPWADGRHTDDIEWIMSYKVVADVDKELRLFYAWRFSVSGIKHGMKSIQYLWDRY